MTASPKHLMDQLREAREALVKRCSDFPSTVIVLGSGLSGFLDEIKVETEISYGEIPHFRSSTVAGHPGRLVIGEFAGRRIACMLGRLHRYEGYSYQEVVFPFRAFALAGADTFLLTNAAGALHPDLRPAELVIIKDHLNLMGGNPLQGPNEAELGVRFLDLGKVYDENLRELIRDGAKRLGMMMNEGVYVSLDGPCYETPAEVRMFRMLGGDMIGMSTVPEAIALHHMGKRVAGISCITNHAAGVNPLPVSHEEVLENAAKASGTFAKLMTEVVSHL